MKKILSLLALMMLCVTGANAETTVKYALSEGDTFSSGQTVEVKNGDAVVATITYGESGGNDFVAAVANTSVDGYTAFTEGNKTNGNKEGGTWYTITPKVDATINVAVVLNGDKKFYIEEDGTALDDYNGITVSAKYYGTYEFAATANKAYKVYCAGSKLGFYGFEMTFTESEEPVVTDKTISLIPGVWDVEEVTERYGVYAWVGEGEEKDEKWIFFDEFGDYLVATVPSSYTGIILTRMSTEKTVNPWDVVWNQTDDIDFTAIADGTIFTITGFSDSPNGKSGYTISNPLEEAKATLTKVIALAEMLDSEELTESITAAKAALTNSEATVETLAAAAQTLLTAVKPVATTVMGELNTFASNYGYTEISNKITALAALLTATPVDIDAVSTAANELVTLAKAAAPEIIEKVEGYASAMDNETLNAAIAAAKATATDSKSSVKDVIAAAKAAIETFKTAAAAFVQTVADANIEDATVQAKLAAVAALGTDASLADYGEAIRQLIAAYQAYQLEQNPVYTVAGTTDLTGYDWDEEKNEMTLNAESGLYEWTAKFITVNADNQPAFKVVRNYETWYPDGDNWVITPDYLGGEGIYTITITFNAETKEIGVAGVKREMPVFAENNVYYWNSPDGYADQNGGTAVGEGDINVANDKYYTIRLRGAKDFSTNTVVITLDQALVAGDEIAITAFRNKDTKEKVSGAKLKFENGSTVLTTGDGKEFNNINAAVESEPEYGEPNTITLTVPEDAAGSKTITLTRSNTGTNLFITKIEITRPEKTFTVTFKNDADPAWEEVYAYTWTGEGDAKVEEAGKWPGTKLEGAEGIFTFTYNGYTAPANIIFNAGEGKPQTENLVFEDGKEYFYWGEHNFTYEKYIVKNVASGKYWGAANDWGTRASLVEHPEYLKLVPMPNGKYNIESQVNNGGTSYYFNGDYMDNDSPIALTVSEVSEGQYTIANGDNYYGWDGTSTILGKNLAADSENALWTIVTLDEAKAALANATVDDPMDATLLIEDHDFGRNNRYSNNWTADGVNNISGGNNINNCAESYHAAFTLSQTLEGAPAGVYALTAQGFYRQDGEDNDNLPVFFANDEKQTFPVKTGSENSMSDASVSFSAGKYTIDPIYVKVEAGGTLTIGAKLETNTALWCIWDNFVLTYYGAEASIDQVKNAAVFAQLEELKAQLSQMLFSEEIEVESVVTELQNVLNNASGEITSVEQAEFVIAGLQDAIAKGEAYIKAKNVLAQMKKLTESTNVYTEEAYNEYYGQWYQKYETAELTAAEANALQDPYVVTGWRASVTCDNFLLSAWDTKPDFPEGVAYYINTWSVEGGSDDTNFVVPFFEYYTGANAALGEKTLTATMTNQAPGEYEVSAWVRVATLENADKTDGYGISMQVNDGEAVNVCNGETKVNGANTNQRIHGIFTAKGTVGEDGNLYIKFIVSADNNIHWLSFQNVKYEAEGSTGISSIAAESTAADGIYTLSGQKVMKAKKGLYIVNGKKVVVK